MSSGSAWPDDRRITVTDLQAATDRGERWSMLTSYDVLTAGIFEQAGVRALLVGDTSAELVLGYSSTLPVTMAELISMTRAVVAGTTTDMARGDWVDPRSTRVRFDTLADTWWATTVKLAPTPLNRTTVAPVNVVPPIVTPLPTGPLAGAKLAIAGATVKLAALVAVPPGVTTLSSPVVAPAGTVA